MTREEWTNNAAIEYGKHISSDSIHSKMASYDFAQGIKYADKNPKSPWISVKDDLPCNHKDLVYHNGRCTVEVLVRDKYGSVYTNVMRKGADNIWFFAREQYNIVEFWMRIPELPK